MTPQKKRLCRSIVIAVVVLAGCAGFQVWYHLFREEPDTVYATVEEQFKYGAGGGEKPVGIPYHLWAVLPEVFADKLPGPGYASLGFIYEPGRELPVGVSSKVVGFPRIANNCAFCHISTWRAGPDAPPTRVLAGSRQDFDPQRYFRFLTDCAADPRFDVEHLMPAISRRFPDLPVVLRLAYRFQIVDTVKKELNKTADRLKWWYDIPDCGPGRWEAFNDLKYHFAKQPIDGGIGNPDIPTLWNIKPRQEAGVFHWDGMNDKLFKTAFNASVGAGTTPETLPVKQLERLMDWWMAMPPPKYPFAIDERLAARGREHWNARCADCHEIGRPGAGRNVPLAEIGTDPERHKMMTKGTIEAYNAWAKATFGGRGDPRWDEWQLRNTAGYNAVFLDGIWLRAPYLHNGSVPTLADLLEEPERRPKVFFRGGDIIDQAKVGFVSDGPLVEKLFRYDTSLPGNRNGGHRYGTDLSAEAKRELLEYLKTL